MLQVGSIPDQRASRGPFVQRSVSVDLCLVRSGERNSQVERRAALDHVANTPQKTVHLAISPQCIAVNKWQVHCLLDEFFVAHSQAPLFGFVTTRRQSCVDGATQCKREIAERVESYIANRGCSELGTRQ